MGFNYAIIFEKEWKGAAQYISHFHSRRHEAKAWFNGEMPFWAKKMYLCDQLLINTKRTDHPLFTKEGEFFYIRTVTKVYDGEDWSHRIITKFDHYSFLEDEMELDWQLGQRSLYGFRVLKSRERKNDTDLGVFSTTSIKDSYLDARKQSRRVE